MQHHPHRLEFLASIRGLAALAVLLGHSFIFVWPLAVGRVISWPVVREVVWRVGGGIEIWMGGRIHWLRRDSAFNS